MVKRTPLLFSYITGVLVLAVPGSVLMMFDPFNLLSPFVFVVQGPPYLLAACIQFFLLPDASESALGTMVLIASLLYYGLWLTPLILIVKRLQTKHADGRRSRSLVYAQASLVAFHFGALIVLVLMFAGH